MAFNFPTSPTEGQIYTAPNTVKYVYSNGRWKGDYAAWAGATGPQGPQGVAGPAGIGYGQAWQDVTSSRAFNTTYTNNTSKPIMVSIACTNSAEVNYHAIVDGTIICSINDNPSHHAHTKGVFIVPVNSTYSLSATPANTPTALIWAELR